MATKRLALGILVLAAASGCQSPTPVTLVTADRQADVLRSCDVVVAGRVVDGNAHYGDLTFWEEISIGGYRKNGWSSVFRMQVRKVLKGAYATPELQMEVNHPDEQNRPNLVRGLVTGVDIWVGWREGAFGSRREVQIILFGKPDSSAK